MKIVKNLLPVLFLNFLVIASPVQAAGNPSPSNVHSSYHQEINWMTNYDEALALAHQKNLPIVLFFTGSGWCHWCGLLEKEVFNTPEFVEATQEKFIFVKLDFPQDRSLDAKTAEQNRRLQAKYHVKGFPTLILIDEHENQIGTAGYAAGGGSKYANQLKTIVDNAPVKGPSGRG